MTNSTKWHASQVAVITDNLRFTHHQQYGKTGPMAQTVSPKWGLQGKVKMGQFHSTVVGHTVQISFLLDSCWKII